MKMVSQYLEPIPCEIIEDDSTGSGKEPDATFQDFLRFVAMRQSLSMAREYETLSNSSEQEEQKSFFLDMANLKHGEYECLQRYEGDGSMVSPASENLPETPRWPDLPVTHRFVTPEDACRFTMNKELDIYGQYLRLADLEEDLVTKGLFLFIVRVHKSSLNYVQNRLQLIASLKEFAGHDEAVAVCTSYSSSQVA